MVVSVMDLEDIQSILLIIITLILYFLTLIWFLPKNRTVVSEEGLTLPISLQRGCSKIPEVNVCQVQVPFAFKLSENVGTDLEIECSISSQVPYCIETYWGVDIKGLFERLHQPWLRESLLEDSSQIMEPTLSKNSKTDERLKLPIPSLNLGLPPRTGYPLVILLRRDPIDENLTGNDILALINVIHVKDSVCSFSSKVIGQYLKHADGEMSILEQLYMVGGNNDTSEDTHGNVLGVAKFGFNNTNRNPLLCTSSTGDDIDIEDLCVVCQYRPLSRVLLPCKHTCVCGDCFERLKRCPMCRQTIEGYFSIRSKEMC